MATSFCCAAVSVRLPVTAWLNQTTICHHRVPPMHIRVTLLTTVCVYFSAQAAASPADLRALAHDYYQWYDTAYPVAASGLGDHRFDARLTDYSMSEVAHRRQHVSALLAQVGAISTD